MTYPAGRVVELWRYPVKSMQGERVDSARLAGTGLEGDRRYALRHAESGRVLTAKRYGQLLEAAATTGADGSVSITVPSGASLGAEDPGTDEAISAWLGLPCRLARPETGDAPEFEMSFDAAHPDQDVFAWPCAEGTFLDLAAAHLLTTSSLRAARALHPDGDWAVRRFRPTAVIDTGKVEGFTEDAWVGQTVGLGDAEVAVMMATVRCPMPSCPQPGGLARDLGVAAALRDHHDNNLGVYASVGRAGTVAEGDDVRLPG